MGKMKTCPLCNLTKAFEYFYTRSSRCKICENFVRKHGAKTRRAEALTRRISRRDAEKRFPHHVRETGRWDDCAEGGMSGGIVIWAKGDIHRTELRRRLATELGRLAVHHLAIARDGGVFEYTHLEQAAVAWTVEKMSWVVKYGAGYWSGCAWHGKLHAYRYESREIAQNVVDRNGGRVIRLVKKKAPKPLQTCSGSPSRPAEAPREPGIACDHTRASWVGATTAVWCENCGAIGAGLFQRGIPLSLTPVHSVQVEGCDWYLPRNRK